MKIIRAIKAEYKLFSVHIKAERLRKLLIKFGVANAKDMSDQDLIDWAIRATKATANFGVSGKEAADALNELVREGNENTGT